MRIILSLGSRTPHLEPGSPDTMGKNYPCRSYQPMRALLYGLWREERGSILVTEWVFVATILVLCILPAALSVRHRIHQALADVKRPGDWDATSWCDLEPAD